MKHIKIMMVTLFISIGIAVLPQKGQGKNGYFYCLGFDYQRCFSVEEICL
jgi:hypothetical protein